MTDARADASLTSLRAATAQAVRRNRIAVSGTVPCTIDKAASAEDFGRGLAELQLAVRASGVSNTALAGGILERLGFEAGHPWRQAAATLGAEADAMGEANPYHNAQHMSDVVLATVNLALAHNRSPAGQAMPFDADDLAALTVAALGHDLGHNGKGNQGTPFLLERQAFQSIDAACRQSLATDPRGLADLRAMIVATDAVNGYAVLRALQQPGGLKGPLEPVAEAALAAEPALRRLEDPKLRQMAYILRDADLFCSLVDPATVDRQNVAMAIESFGGADKATPEGFAFFASNIAGGRFFSEAAQPLNPLIAETMQDNAHRIAMGDPKMTLAAARVERKPAAPVAPARRPAPAHRG